MYLAVDIGGTKTLIALFSKRGRLIRRKKFKTAQGSRTFLNNLKEALIPFLKYDVSSVVVAIPGIVQKNYSVHFGNRNWDGVRIFPLIKELFDCPIYFENDASLGALYEASFLKGKTVFLTFSTGIGGGVIKDGKVLPESASFEPGHKIYEYDGKKKEWEDIAAASAIENHYHIDQATSLRGKTNLQDVANRIYLGLPDIVNEYKPDNIVLGGPMGKIFKVYTKYLPKGLKVKLYAPKRPLESVVYGCYLYAKQKSK